MSARKTLRRWHLWLGWLVGVPFLIWTLSGLVMVAKPIEEVRGEHLLAPPAAIELSGAPQLPDGLDQIPLSSIELQQRVRGPVWVIPLSGRIALADAATGEWVEAYDAEAALAEVTARYKGEGANPSVEETDPNDPPIDWRRTKEAFAVTYDNGDRFYVDAATGAIEARRTGWWRVYDFFWGLHIMDLETREDSHNPWLVTFAVLSLVTTLLALVLLPMSTGRKKR